MGPSSVGSQSSPFSRIVEDGLITIVNLCISLRSLLSWQASRLPDFFLVLILMFREYITDLLSGAFSKESGYIWPITLIRFRPCLLWYIFGSLTISVLNSLVEYFWLVKTSYEFLIWHLNPKFWLWRLLQNREYVSYFHHSPLGFLYSICCILVVD